MRNRYNSSNYMVTTNSHHIWNSILRNRRAFCDMAGSRKPKVCLIHLLIFIHHLFLLHFLFPFFHLLLVLWSHHFLQLGPSRPTFLLSTTGRRIPILVCVKRCIFPCLSHLLVCCKYRFRYRYVFICVCLYFL